MDSKSDSENIQVMSGKSPRTKRPYLRLLIVVVGLVVIISVIATIAHNNKSIAAAQVSITKSGFLPATISIKTGQAVVWTNDTNALHQVSSDPYPTDNALTGFNSQKPLSDGQTYSYVFSKAGTYTYHDNLNPYTVKGIVIVK